MVLSTVPVGGLDTWGLMVAVLMVLVINVVANVTVEPEGVKSI